MRKTVDPDALSIALAEPSRRALLENLRFGQKSVTELVHATQLKQPNVSNHLAKMRQQGIVRAERIGRQVYYSLSMPFADVLLRMHEFASNPAASTITGEVYAEPATPSTAAPSVAMEAPGTRHTDMQHGSHLGEAGTAHSGSEVASATTLPEWRNTYFQSILTGKEDQATSLVNGMLAQGVDMQIIYVEVFQWAINRIGELYQQGVTDEAHEHMASAMTERMMARVAQFHTPVTRSQHRAVLGCVAGNWHTLGLRMLADGLRGIGWNTLFLGANVPTASFVSMVEKIGPDLTVITCATEEQAPDLHELIARLRALRSENERQTFAIAAGGHYIQTHTQVLPGLDLDLTAPDLPRFMEQVRARFAPPRRN